MLLVEVVRDATTGISTVSANGISVHATFDHDEAVRFARGYLAHRGGGTLEHHDGLRLLSEHVGSASHGRSLDDGAAGQHSVVTGR